MSCTGYRLPIDQRTVYKPCLMVYKCQHHRAPSYLSSLLGVSILRGDDARCVIEILGGKKNLLKILYIVLKRPVGHDQNAYK